MTGQFLTCLVYPFSSGSLSHPIRLITNRLRICICVNNTETHPFLSLQYSFCYLALVGESDQRDLRSLSFLYRPNKVLINAYEYSTIYETDIWFKAHKAIISYGSLTSSRATKLCAFHFNFVVCELLVVAGFKFLPDCYHYTTGTTLI